MSLTRFIRKAQQQITFATRPTRTLPLLIRIISVCAISICAIQSTHANTTQSTSIILESQPPATIQQGIKQGIKQEIKHQVQQNEQQDVIPNIDPELKRKLTEAVSMADSFNDRFDAEVWLMDMSTRLKRFIKDDEIRLDLLRLVHREATLAKLPPELVLAVIHVESAFDRFALSYVGAQGYMQVMPFWKKEIGRVDDNLMLTETNLRYGCTILRHYLDIEKGNWTRALGRYNGSLGKMKYPNKVMSRLDKYWAVR